MRNARRDCQKWLAALKWMACNQSGVLVYMLCASEVWWFYLLTTIAIVKLCLNLCLTLLFHSLILLARSQRTRNGCVDNGQVIVGRKAHSFHFGTHIFVFIFKNFWILFDCTLFHSFAYSFCYLVSPSRALRNNLMGKVIFILLLKFHRLPSYSIRLHNDIFL